MWYIYIGLVYEMLNLVLEIVTSFMTNFRKKMDAVIDGAGSSYEGETGYIIAGIVFRVLAWPCSIAYSVKLCYDFFSARKES